jgi:hypothetical protein
MPGTKLASGARLTPFAFEEITVSTAAIGFTAATFKPSGQTPAAYAYVTVETNGIRWRTDGSDPTSSVGHALAAGGTLELAGKTELTNFRAIRSGGADAALKVTFYR